MRRNPQIKLSLPQRHGATQRIQILRAIQRTTIYQGYAAIDEF
jgi:hypothetical protein